MHRTLSGIQPGIMNNERLTLLLSRYFEDSISEAELRELDVHLQTQPQARVSYLQEARIHGALREWGLAEGNLSVLHSTSPQSATPPLTASEKERIERLFPSPLRSILQIAASLVIGAILSSVVWSYSTRSTAAGWINQPIAVDRPAGAPEELPLPAGAPLSFGVLSGDPASWTLSPDGTSPRSALRFIQAGADAAGPAEMATSCDVFQLLDLSNVPRDGGETLLEVSVEHADFSANPSPSHRFGCRIFTYEGCPSEIMTQWPKPMEKALSSAASYVVPGTAHLTWKRLSAKATVPPTAQFAIVQLVASDVSRNVTQPAIFGSLYARDIQIHWKRIPSASNPLAKK
jgi:hypothetical protein